MSKASEDLRNAATEVEQAASDALHGEGGAAKADLAAAGGDVVQAAKDVRDGVEGAVKAQVDRVKGFFKTVFGYPLHDPTQGVTITSDGAHAEHTEWIEGQIEAGTIVGVEEPK